MSAAPIAIEVPLPRNYRVAETLEFHQRDREEVAERVVGRVLHKALFWRQHPACLTVQFRARHAAVTLAIDGRARADDTVAVKHLARHMLGLTQPVAAFERAFRHHPILGGLVLRHSGLRVPLVATPFEALTWAVTCQQISMRAAVAMRRKLIRQAGRLHSSGLICYPDAAGVAALDESRLRAVGYSASKAQTLVSLARSVCSGEIPLERWMSTLPIEEMREKLLSMRGIGPWTVDYALMRGFGWLDGSLHGDMVVRRQLQQVLGLPEQPSVEETRAWLVPFSPWRALVAFHLWATKAK